MEQTDQTQMYEVRALIRNESAAYLLIYIDDWGWQAPGGYVHFGESPHHALTRHLEEQLSVQSIIVDKEIATDHRISDSGRQHIMTYFRVELPTATLDPNTELINKHGWYTLDSLPSDVHEYVTRALLQNEKELGN